MFTLHPKLAEETFYLGNFLLSRVLLMNNACFPWIILVPQREFIVELTDISSSGRMLLMEEASLIITVLKKIHTPDKINLASLGNDVPQFHLHIVARFHKDAAWPDAVWGKKKSSVPYSLEQMHTVSSALIDELKNYPNFTILPNS